jgi:hypothetical protein
MQDEERKWNRFASTDGKAIIVTKDYLDWLVRECNFKVSVIHNIFYYKTSNILNKIYQDLITERNSPTISPGRKQLIKNIVNFSAGFYGFNNNKNHAGKHKIVVGIDHNYNTLKHHMMEFQTLDFKNLCIKQTNSIHSKERKRKACQTAFPLFINIVEFGKLRLSQILCHFDTCLDPDKYRHLYTNVDNIVFVLSTPSLDEAVKPEFRQKFMDEKANYFTPNSAGHLKEEYKITVDRDWKFVSPRSHHYSIITNDMDVSVHKNSSVKGLSSEEYFKTNLAILNKEKITVEQERRVNKTKNMETKKQMFTFN